MSSFDPVAGESLVFEARDFREQKPFQRAGDRSGLEAEAHPPADAANPETSEPSEERAQAEQRQRVWQEGYDAAREALRREMVESFEPARQALAESANSLARQRQEYLAVHREALAELALAVAERIVGAELAERPEHLNTWVRDALSVLEDAQDRGIPRVYVCPDDLECIRNLGRDGEEGVEWVEDAQLVRGEARVERGASTVRVGIRAGVAAARQVLAKDIPMEEGVS